MGIFSLFKGKGETSGRDLNELARRIGIDAELLRAINPIYREHQIPKRSGGMRTIHAPEPKLKELQRLILKRVLGRLPVHPAVTGFERGQSIATNAARHAGHPVILRLDIKDFFNSTSAKRVEAYFKKIGWDKESSQLLTRLTTHKGGLPQGAPTSPRLANLVNFKMDRRVAAMTEKLSSVNTRRLQPIPSASGMIATYTRYADDLTISFSVDCGVLVRELIEGIQRIVKNEGYELHFKKKLSIRRSHQRQIVTGLVVNRGVNLPRETRRRLRAVAHHLKTGKPATMTEQQLAGWRALEGMIRNQAGQ